MARGAWVAFLSLTTTTGLFSASCWDDSHGRIPDGGNTDTDTDADSDTDTDTDADGDSDGDSGTPCTLYVIGASGSDTENGSTWGEGLATVERGLDLAEIYGCGVWVKAGIYYPTEDPDGSGTPDDPRTVTFLLRAGMAIYGGFAGDETFLDQRDLEANETTLSGDIGIAGDGSDNAYHVVTGANDAMIDGFTITAASDGGMVNESSSPTVTSCTFSGNTAEAGGGMLNIGSSPTVANCVFSGNSAEAGGGMANNASSPIVTGCTFSGNTAELSGGGMMNLGESSSPTVTGCIFLLNSSLGEGYEYGGGGMSNYGSSPTVTNCTFSGNSAFGGGGMENYGASPVVASSIFIGNFAEMVGGAMFNYDISSPIVSNCTFSGNTAAPSGGGAILNDGGLPVVTNCILWGDTENEIDTWSMDFVPTVTYSAVQGGCSAASGCTTNETGNIDIDPLFVSMSDFHLQDGSPCIDTGLNDVVPSGVTTDLDGNARIVDGNGDGTATVDMGAYEF